MKLLAAISAFLLLGGQGLLPVLTYTDALSLVATRHKGANHSQIDGFISARSSRVKTRHSHTKSIDCTFDGSISNIVVLSSHRVPKVFFLLNSATKWLVSIAATAGVLWNPKTFRGPYIVVGSIGATVLASKLKRLINQGRPEGAPFTDPGMPSSHALVSFFIASAWIQHLADGGQWAMTAALGVSALRVICGYHTAPQIAVGGLLGTLLGYSWSNLGVILDVRYTHATFVISWAAYVLSSALYIRREVVRWCNDEKYL